MFLSFTFRSAFAATTSPRNKDIVIMIDSSSSMTLQSGVTNKIKFVLVKEAARIVIQTLNPNDRVCKYYFWQSVVRLLLYYVKCRYWSVPETIIYSRFLENVKNRIDWLIDWLIDWSIDWLLLNVQQQHVECNIIYECDWFKLICDLTSLCIKTYGSW